MKCVFCDYKNTVRKEHIIYKDENFVSFLSKKAMAEGHTLVVPKNHAESVNDLSSIKYFFILTEKIADAVSRAMGADVVNIQITCGEAIRQSQPHLFVHIIPVHQKELGYFRDMPKLTAEQMDEIAERIRNALKNSFLQP